MNLTEKQWKFIEHLIPEEKKVRTAAVARDAGIDY